jgi:hypothetical protein
MKTSFIDLTTKHKIREDAFKGDKVSINILIEEIDRLESLIKDYEIVLEMVESRIKSDRNKNPKFD